METYPEIADESTVACEFAAENPADNDVALLSVDDIPTLSETAFESAIDALVVAVLMSVDCEEFCEPVADRLLEITTLSDTAFESAVLALVVAVLMRVD